MNPDIPDTHPILYVLALAILVIVVLSIRVGIDLARRLRERRRATNAEQGTKG